MIQILPCGECNRQLLLPVDVSACGPNRVPALWRAVRSRRTACNPLCPLGKLIDAPHHLRSPINAATVPVPTDFDDGTELKLADEPTLAVAPVESNPTNGERNAKQKTDWSKFQPITHEQFERNKRKSRSPIWSIIQVALGGLAAIPVALLILWHGLGQDVADAGPQVARYVPWIVPERFHPAQNRSTTADEPNVSPQENKFREFGPSQDTESESAAHESPESPESAESRQPEPDSSIEMSPTSELPQAEVSPSDLSDADAATLGIDLFSLIQSCEGNLDAWNVAFQEGSDRQELAKQIYVDLSGFNHRHRNTPHQPAGRPHHP